MTAHATVAAVDLGASNGRVVVGRVGPDTVDLTETGRFANVPVHADGRLHWDILRIYEGVLDGLRSAGPVDSIGVDSWAVDFGLLDADGALLGNPVHYRDRRTDGVMEAVLAEVGPEWLYRGTGIQFLPFNTVFQLAAIRDTAQFAAARTLLLIPDLIAYWLTGEARTELTNASTTQLLNVDSGHWHADLPSRLGIPPGLFAPLCRPGDRIGSLTEAVRARLGLAEAIPVTAVGSHDTASAVAAVPAVSPNFGYISCGTWSLVGVETDRPILTEDGRLANFTNELGVDGTVRYLRNVMGLWLLQESVRTWRDAGRSVDLSALLNEAAARPALAAVVDPDDPVFLPPGDMPARIADRLAATGQPTPTDPAGTVRCIVDSLALAHRRAVDDARRLSGKDVEVVHIVGGGVRNELLCQLTADACGLPVEAGPVEATALGNVLVQARSLGAVDGDLTALRALVRRTQAVRRYEPAGDGKAWESALGRLDRS